MLELNASDAMSIVAPIVEDIWLNQSSRLAAMDSSLGEFSPGGIKSGMVSPKWNGPKALVVAYEAGEWYSTPSG
jgi:hypothetical protein